MPRNRKHQPAALRFGVLVKTILVCALVGGSGIGYVWQKTQIEELGRKIAKREEQLSLLEEQNEKLKNQLATMRSPSVLLARVKELGLGLIEAQPSQILRLTEPLPQVPTDRERQYAGGAGGVPSSP